MKYWHKIEIGWYESKKGEIIQCWYRSLGAPLNKAGWYLWPITMRAECLGPYKTMKEAMSKIKIN